MSEPRGVDQVDRLLLQYRCIATGSHYGSSISLMSSQATLEVQWERRQACSVAAKCDKIPPLREQLGALSMNYFVGQMKDNLREASSKVDQNVIDLTTRGKTCLWGVVGVLGR
jgi:hypothetical protein